MMNLNQIRRKENGGNFGLNDNFFEEKRIR